jgi:predicted HicB family RNase H-like nuclease
MRLKKNTDNFIKNAKADKESNKFSDKDTKLKRLVVDLPEELHKELKIMSAKEGKKMRELIVEMIEKRIEGNK